MTMEGEQQGPDPAPMEPGVHVVRLQAGSGQFGLEVAVSLIRFHPGSTNAWPTPVATDLPADFRAALRGWLEQADPSPITTSVLPAGGEFLDDGMVGELAALVSGSGDGPAYTLRRRLGFGVADYVPHHQAEAALREALRVVFRG